MRVAVSAVPSQATAPHAEYRWDVDTDILTARTVRAVRDILFELDDGHHIAGIWMLNVPPFPGSP